MPDCFRTSIEAFVILVRSFKSAIDINLPFCLSFIIPSAAVSPSEAIVINGNLILLFSITNLLTSDLYKSTCKNYIFRASASFTI